MEVPNHSRSHNCKCPVLPIPNLAFLLAPTQVLVLHHHHLPHSEEILGAALHLDSRVSPQTKVRAGGLLLVRVQRCPRIQVEDSRSRHRSLGRTHHLPGFTFSQSTTDSKPLLPTGTYNLPWSCWPPPRTFVGASMMLPTFPISAQFFRCYLSSASPPLPPYNKTSGHATPAGPAHHRGHSST